MNQPVFPYTRMRTRKVGGGNARKNSLGTPARFLGREQKSVRANQIAAFAGLNSSQSVVTFLGSPVELSRQYCHLRLQRAAKGFVERHDVCVGMPTGGRLLVTVLLPAFSFLFKKRYP